MQDKRLRLVDDLDVVQTYVAVVETNSITRAAQRLGVMPSTVSKKLSDFEARAKATLLHRTTRKIAVTELGQRFYEQCLRLLDEAERTEWELRDKLREPGGRVRMTAPVVFAQRQIARLLPAFIRTHPRISLELVASARNANLIEEGFDLSIRLTDKEHLSDLSRVLAPNRRIFCASPDYLDREGEPTHPIQLSRRDCLIAITAQRADVWHYQEDGATKAVRIAGPLASDNVATLVEAAVMGAGIIKAGTFVVGQELRSGRLREILPDFTVLDSYFVAIVPARGRLPYRVSVLIDYLAKAFGDPPIWDRLDDC